MSLRYLSTVALEYSKLIQRLNEAADAAYAATREKEQAETNLQTVKRIAAEAREELLNEIKENHE